MLRSLALLVLAWSAVALPSRAITPDRTPGPALRLPAQPASALESALGTLRFTSPVAIASPPGETNRLFVVEQTGRIIVITNLAAPTRTVFLDLVRQTVSGGEQGLLGLAFHPRYAENGRFFVFRTVTASTRGNPNRLHDRLSEFRVSDLSPHTASTNETILFQQYDQASNHNGGDIHFGPDGYLYVALGDEGGGNDQYNNGQTITRDFFAGIFRIDVDARPDSLPPNPHPANEDFPGRYHVPPDNPFVNATHFLGRPIADPSLVRTEFFAVGLRNPWRMSFDPATGDLWVADVGQGARESIYITRNGANHGWPFREGPITGPRQGAPAGFTTNPDFNHVPPLHSYSHGSGPNQGRSITGGIVYRGSRFPSLAGAYVFADYVSGNVWSLHRRETGAPQVQRLLGETGISAFGRDPRDGDVLIADLDGGRILRLVPGTTGGQPLPLTLADTGAFADLASLTPVPGVVPYDINLPFWSDGAEKRRWFHVPGSLRLGFTPSGAWSAPTGTVWIKHFELPLGPSPTSPRQRLETRFLVRNTSGVYGVTYRWTSPTQATLVPDEGETVAYTVGSGDSAQTVNWRFPSRAECLACHNPTAGGSLSFDTPQLSRTITLPDGSTRNQIAALADAGYLDNPPDHPEAFRTHPHPADDRWSLEARARSYLAVNCAPCHQPGGTLGGGFFNTRLETLTDAAGLILGPLNNPGPNPDSRVVVPGHPSLSALLQRILSTGPDRMPPISSGIVDTEGADLLARWILSATNRTDFPTWLSDRFDPAVAEAADRQRDADNDGAPDYLEFLTGSDPVDPADFWRLHALAAPAAGDAIPRPRVAFRHPPGVSVALEATDDVLNGPWIPWSTPDDPPWFPAEGSNREILIPETRAPLFLRARITAP